MKLRFFHILIFVLAASFSFGQPNEIGLFGGGSYYIGDLNPHKHYSCTHLAGGLFYRANFNKRYSLRISGTYGTVSAADSLSTSADRQAKSLSFKSRIIELGGIFEINFIKYQPGKIDREYGSPYLFMGLAYFNMNPQGQFEGDWYQLQSLGTEGQGNAGSRQYSLNQISIPLGIGYKGNLTKRLAINFEYGIRKTFTDYLDDVSGSYVDATELSSENGPLAAQFGDPSGTQIGGTPRGNPKNKDWYSFSGVALTFLIGRDDGCPKWR